MRSLSNALVWLGLMIGLPGVIYSMSPASQSNQPCAKPHSAEKCGVCRYFRDVKPMPPPITDENMILVAPGHWEDSIDSSGGE
jgi:hypothetical protein